jgi:hypothetical protein
MTAHALRRSTLMLTAASLVLGTQTAQASPARQWLAPPATAASPLYSDPAPPGSPAEAELAAHGFIREERFLSGQAKVHGYGPDGQARVIQRGVPYVTRLVIIRPKDPAGFSGRAHLVPIHPSSSQTPWEWLRPYVLSHGDAFVAVMAGGDVPSREASKPGAPGSAPLVLMPFNPERYAPIAWPEEDGIRWDVFAQTAKAVKDGEVLGGLKPRRLYASGWSFTGSFLRTFINEGFHDRARDEAGKPIIDGYLIGISSSSYRAGYLPLNATTPARPVGDPVRVTRSIDVPVIELMSQNEAVTNTGPQAPESDAAGARHRLYELPGLTHGDGLRGDGRPMVPASGCPYATSDVPMSHFAHAALENLDLWLAGGPPPPHAERLKIDPATGQAAVDGTGNALGGLRPAQLDAPLAVYAEPTPEAGCPKPGGPAGGYVAIRRTPLSGEALARLYPGGKTDYLARFQARLDALVAERWLLAEDASIERRNAQAYADEAFR